MELRHLRYFVTVAEELQLTRAAEELGMKQPPLSLQIQQLENELGTRLFKRLTRGIEITDTGALLLDKARRILVDIDQMTTAIQSHARGETGRIHVGFAGATYSPPLVPQIIRAYRERYPGVLLAPQQSNTSQLLAALRGGDTDVAFIHPPVRDMERLVGQEAPQISSIIYMVASAFGVSIVPRSSEITVEGVLYLPIEGEGPLAHIGLAYRRDDPSTAVGHFVEIARRLARASKQDRSTVTPSHT